MTLLIAAMPLLYGQQDIWKKAAVLSGKPNAVANRVRAQAIVNDSWLGGVGNWSNPALWSTGVPGTGNDVFIDKGKPGASTVNMDINGNINNLTVDSDDALHINNNVALKINGSTITNAGNVSLNSSGYLTELILNSGNVTLTGGGTLSMSNNANNVIVGTIMADTLTNQETIQGSGNIGNGSMTLVNSGTIDANQSHALTIAANGGTTNTGTLEATAGGTLGFNGTTVKNTNATINTSGGGISAVNSTINGGTVTLAGGLLQASTVNGATVTVSGNSNLQLSNVSFTNGTLTNNAQIETVGGFSNTVGGTVTNAVGKLIQIDNNTGLHLQPGTYSNAGTISLNSTGYPTELVIDAANVTLTGGGKIVMSNNPNNFIFGGAAADTLTNQETIQGSGNIGNGSMTLVNSGTINANQSNALTIAANGGTTNTGTLEATAGGTLGFNGTTVANTNATINTSSGGISAVNSTINGGAVTLAGGLLQASTVNGATVTLSGNSNLQLNNGSFTNGTLTNNAQMETLSGFSNTIGGTVTNAAGKLIRIDNNTGLHLQPGTYSNAGTISLNSTGYPTELVIDAANVTLSGGGKIIMSNNPNNFIFGGAAADTLTNQETIQGSGNIGDGSMTLVNSGTINANQLSALTIAANGGTTNTGTLEATAGGTLGFNGTTVTNTNAIINTSGGGISAVNSTINGGTVTLAGGLLQASTVNGATVTLSGNSNLQLNNGSFTNGTLTNNAQMETLSGFSNTIGGTVTNAAGKLIRIDNNTGLHLQLGTYSNAGTISLNSTGYPTELVIDAANVTLTGGGKIIMSNNPNNFIFGGAAADTLTNQETIQGSGNIGSGSMTLVNSGTIDANQSNALTIAANGGTTNTGMLEATAGGTLGFNGTTVTNTNAIINTSGGSVSAVNSTINGGTVTLAGGLLQASTINGANVTVSGNSNLQLNNGSFTNGTLTSNAQIETVSGFSNTVGGTVTNAAGKLIQIDNNTALRLQPGTYSNAGTISLNSTGYPTELVIDAANITLSGGGKIVMSNNANNLIVGAAAADTLTNQETIQGSGNIGNGTMGLINSGTINANQSVPLIINTSSAGFNNPGTLAVGPGSTLQITTTTPFKNFSGTTLTGGTYNVNGTLQFGASGTSLVTNAANIALTNFDSKIVDAAGNDILKNFATNAAGASFTLGGTRSFATAGNFTNNGSLSVGSGSTFAVTGNLTNFSGTTLTGGTYNVGGTLQFKGANIVTNSANLTLTGASSKITDQGGTVNALANFATNSATGVFTLSGNQNLTVAGGFTNAGTLTVAKGGTFSLSNAGAYTQTGGMTTVDGTLQSSVNTAALNLNKGSLFGTGALGFSVVNTGVVTPADSGVATGSLAVTGAYKQNSGGALDISIAGTTPGTKYDQLKVAGTATVSGTLNLSLLNGFVPAVGTTFAILTGSAVSGQFSTVTGTQINGSEHFVVSCSTTFCDATVAGGAFNPIRAIAVSRLLGGSRFSSPTAGMVREMRRVSVPSMVRAPVISRIPAFQPQYANVAQYRQPALANVPANRAGQGRRGLEFGVDMGALARTGPRTMMRGFAGSAGAPTLGYLASTIR